MIKYLDTDHKGQYQYILFKNKVSNPRHKNKRNQCCNSFHILAEFNILILVNAKLVSTKIQNVYTGTKYEIIISMKIKTATWSGELHWNSMNMKDSLHIYIVHSHLNFIMCKNIIHLYYSHAKCGHFKTELLEINNNLQLETAGWKNIV
jgi:hypothetical protein